VCAFKDTIAAAVPPGLKKPLDVAETLENKNQRARRRRRGRTVARGGGLETDYEIG